MLVDELQRQRYRRRVRSIGLDPDDMPIKVAPCDEADRERVERVAAFMNWQLAVLLEEATRE